MIEFLTNLDRESALLLSDVDLRDPVATPKRTVEELKAAGIVGVYGERKRPQDRTSSTLGVGNGYL